MFKGCVGQIEEIEEEKWVHLVDRDDMSAFR
jgi:hypothetical protein